MTTFTPKQIAFAQKYLKARFELRSDRDDDLDEGLLTELSGRVRATIKTLPRAERVLSGLLGAAEKALRTGGAAEYRRQTDMLAERLENWEQLAELPDVKSVLEKGFLEKSQELTPEDVRAMQVAYEEATTIVEVLPESVRSAAVSFVAEISRLRMRGETLVLNLQKGALGPIERAAHHSEVDQIYRQVEALAENLSGILKKEDLL